MQALQYAGNEVCLAGNLLGNRKVWNYGKENGGCNKSLLKSVLRDFNLTCEAPRDSSYTLVKRRLSNRN